MKNKLIVLIPAYWSCIIDLILTASSQATEYWDGQLQLANEGNPIVAFFMQQSVFGIYVFVLLWLLLISAIAYFLPSLPTRILSLFLVIAHTWGASTWGAYKYGFWFVIILILINSTVFVILENQYTSKIQKTE